MDQKKRKLFFVHRSSSIYFWLMATYGAPHPIDKKKREKLITIFIMKIDAIFSSEINKKKHVNRFYFDHF